jgi:hypothetical protein
MAGPLGLLASTSADSHYAVQYDEFCRGSAEQALSLDGKRLYTGMVLTHVNGEDQVSGLYK